MVKASNLAKKREVVALTGASNYLGIGVMKRLIDDPRVDRVIAIDVQKPSLEHAKVIYYKVDLTNPASQQIMGRIFKNEGVTRCVHLVFTYTLSHNRMLAHELEAIGTMHVLDACYDAEVTRIVGRSTTAIYGARRGNPNFLTERHEPDTHHADSFVYDKLELERQLMQYGRNHPETSVIILRDCTSIGATSLNYLSRLLLASHTPRVLGYDPMIQLIHEEDLFRAYQMVIMGDSRGIYNVVGKGVVRYSEAIRKLGGGELVLPESILRAGTSVLWGLKMFDVPSTFIDHIKYSWVADGTKAALDLGFVPRYDCFKALEDTYLTRLNRVA